MIGIALLGAGRMARVHANAIGAAGGKLVTVYDVVESAAASLAAESGASVAHSTEEVFDRPDIAAVLVATSSNTHVEFILKAVEAGKAVMCEKPLAPNLKTHSGASMPWVSRQAMSFWRLIDVSTRGILR